MESHASMYSDQDKQALSIFGKKNLTGSFWKVYHRLTDTRHRQAWFYCHPPRQKATSHMASSPITRPFRDLCSTWRRPILFFHRERTLYDELEKNNEGCKERACALYETPDGKGGLCWMEMFGGREWCYELIVYWWRKIAENWVLQ